MARAWNEQMASGENSGENFCPDYSTTNVTNNIAATLNKEQCLEEYK